jgi:hypothetical protein
MQCAVYSVQCTVYCILLTVYCLLLTLFWTDGTHLRHLIIFPIRVSQTVVGEHELEATAHWQLTIDN